MAGKRLYSDEQKQKVLTIVNNFKGEKNWDTLANSVNSSNIFPRKFKNGRDLFKSVWAWNNAKNKSKNKNLVIQPKRAYRRRNAKPEIQVLPVANVRDENVIVLVVKSFNIRSVLEQLQ